MVTLPQLTTAILAATSPISDAPEKRAHVVGDAFRACAPHVAPDMSPLQQGVEGLKITGAMLSGGAVVSMAFDKLRNEGEPAMSPQEANAFLSEECNGFTVQLDDGMQP